MQAKYSKINQNCVRPYFAATFFQIKKFQTIEKHYGPVDLLLTLRNVCAVHPGVFSTLGISLSTPGGVQYTRDITEYTRGCSVHWGVSLSTPRVFSTLGDIMSTPRGVQYSGGYHNEYGGYHEYTEGCSVHWGFHTNSIVFPMTFPHIYHDIPPIYSWYPPSVLMISPSVLMIFPTVLMISPGVLNIPHCTALPRCTALTLRRVLLCRTKAKDIYR